jgi:hypothetical protein
MDQSHPVLAVISVISIKINVLSASVRAIYECLYQRNTCDRQPDRRNGRAV